MAAEDSSHFHDEVIVGHETGLTQRPQLSGPKSNIRRVISAPDAINPRPATDHLVERLYSLRVAWLRFGIMNNLQ